MAKYVDTPVVQQKQSTGVLAQVYQDAYRVDIDLTGLTLPAIAGGANLAVGRAIYEFPAGPIKVLGSALKGVSLTQTEGNVTADTPDLGLGTTIASGAVALLSGTAAFENILTGQTMDDCDGTAETTAVATELLILTGDSHTLYLNVADGWAADGEAAMIVGGVVSVSYVKL